MTRNIYALLVGIDNYDPASGINSLTGCVNDIGAVEAYLQNRVAQDGKWEVKPLILKNQDATREAIIKGFQEHLTNANSNDIALFYYAGHGSYQATPQEFWEIEQSRQQQTIVCYDSRTENAPDLADKELGYLISRVAQKNPHIMVIMDCCHSATGTRDPEVIVRQAPINTKSRSLDSFIFTHDQVALEQLLNANKNYTASVEWLKGRHIALAACRSDQVAEEYKDKDGNKRGVFSYFLLETLQKANGNLTYQDLLRNVNALVNGKAQRGQSPQVEAVNKDDLNQLFLGGAISEHPPHFILAFNEYYKSWIIQGGAVHGIPKSAGEDTVLAIFPAASTTESLRELSNKIAVAKVNQVLSQISKVEIAEGIDNLSKNESYWAIVTSLPIEPLKVYIQGEVGEEEGVNLAIDALETASFGKPSLFVQQVEESKDADYFLLARNSQYWITQKDKRPLIAPVPEQPSQNGYTQEFARDAILRLESIARWNNILELESPATSQVKPEDIEMKIIDEEGQELSSSKSDIRLNYIYDENYSDSNTGHWKPASFKIKLINNSEKTLYCNVLVLSENYEVSVSMFDEESSFKLMPKKESKLDSIRITDLFDIHIPPEYLEQGITEYKDIFKLIVSTSEFDASVLKQEGFNPPPPPTRSVGSLGILDSLMEQVNSRAPQKSSRGNNDDWMTKQVTLTYVHPQDTKQIKQDESTTLLNGIVELQPHPSLQAKANLSTLSQVTRDVTTPALPPVLVQDPKISQPFQFTISRGSDPGLSVLELTEVENRESVTPEMPLKLLVDVTLGENEYVLPLAYDGEFYLPLGRAVKTPEGKTEILLESLPSSTDSSRSLSGSVKILFQKLVTQPLGAPFEYPILAMADVGEDGKLIVNPENKKLENVKAKVAQSERILLYIHGLIGDTESLVGSVQTAKIAGQPIHELYDLVLTFDYENLSTTIQQNAQLLRDRLEAVGLGANHGKELHIIAHSMGGLVSRWFIEREGGNQIIQHLIMLGTPNAGSPWSKIQDLAFTLLGVALNQLSTIVWPMKILAQLVKIVQANENSLKQMQPDCDFLQEIAKNPDPHVHYTIIAGNRSLASTASQADIEKQTRLLKNLMQKQFRKAVDDVVNLVFFEQPNDIAVTLNSIKSVNHNRSPQPRILPDVACDHLNYFTHPAGLQALANALEVVP